MIVTFYSYKGGVGRSMALANVAAWLRLQGLNVVMIDWDLEAPGLESFFATDSIERSRLRSNVGLVDLIGMYKDVFPSLPKPALLAESSGDAYDPFAQLVATLDDTLPPIAHTLIPIRMDAAGATAGKLSLLSAGSRNDVRFDRYAQTVQQFDWEEFYANFEGEAYFEWLRRQLLRPGVAEVVLIDSRTGVAEMSGVCTRQLADIVVMLCAPNEQNLEGTVAMARSFTRPDLVEARRGRSIELLPIPARVDVSEGRPYDLFEAQFHTTLDPFTSKLLQRLPVAKSPLRIPYIREYAYAEQLAIGDPNGVKILQQAYITLAAHVVALAGANSAVRQACRHALQETFGLSSVLITGLDQANADFAFDISARLDQAGIIVFHTAEPPEAVVETSGAAPRNTYGAIVLAIASYDCIDTRIRDLWRRSRQLGVALVLAVESRDEKIEKQSPSWSRWMPIYDVTKDFDQLVKLLQNPIFFAPVPFMAPPQRPGFVGRTHEIAQIKELLGLGADKTLGKKNVSRRRVIAVVGLGGSGKTALMRAVCHDDEVIDWFDDGIVWMSLSGEQDSLSAAKGLLSAFGEDVSGITHIDEAERRIATHLASKRCLVVVDDVFDVSQLKLISNIGRQARAVITTRSPDIATAVDAVQFALATLSPAEANTFITRQGLHQEIAEQLARKLDYQPLALELAEQLIKRGVSANDLIERIDDEGVTAIDTGNLGDSASVFTSLMSSLEALPQEDRQRLPMLASLPSAEPIDLETFARSSGIGRNAAGSMARRMAAISLISFDNVGETVTISPLVHAFLRSLLLRQDRAEASRRSTPEAVDGIIGISYRRNDTAGVAGRLYDRLSQHFGFDCVFFESISLGEDFVEAIERRIDRAAAWLVVIGPNWLQSTNSQGGRRLDDPTDFVRIEIATALQREIPVIPILVDGARMPQSGQLPAMLKKLAYRNALELDYRSFNQGVDRLIQELERLRERFRVTKVSATDRSAPAE